MPTKKAAKATRSRKKTTEPKPVCGAPHYKLNTSCTRPPLHPADVHTDGPPGKGTSWAV
ncbi:MAG: hypothetical protein KY455_10180 [Euryarchaeota archaeon]|nr:hypothetical protein [Euryarchaeota archaeon]